MVCWPPWWVASATYMSEDPFKYFGDPYITLLQPQYITYQPSTGHRNNKLLHEGLGELRLSITLANKFDKRAVIRPLSTWVAWLVTLWSGTFHHCRLLWYLPEPMKSVVELEKHFHLGMDDNDLGIDYSHHLTARLYCYQTAAINALPECQDWDEPFDCK